MRDRAVSEEAVRLGPHRIDVLARAARGVPDRVGMHGSQNSKHCGPVRSHISNATMRSAESFLHSDHYLNTGLSGIIAIEIEEEDSCPRNVLRTVCTKPPGRRSGTSMRGSSRPTRRCTYSRARLGAYSIRSRTRTFANFSSAARRARLRRLKFIQSRRKFSDADSEAVTSPTPRAAGDYLSWRTI